MIKINLMIQLRVISVIQNARFITNNEIKSSFPGENVTQENESNVFEVNES